MPEAISMPTFPANTIASAILAPFASAIGVRTERTLESCSGLFAAQSFCGANLILAPFAPPLLSEPRNVEALAQAVSTISEIERPLVLIASFIELTS